MVLERLVQHVLDVVLSFVRHIGKELQTAIGIGEVSDAQLARNSRTKPDRMFRERDDEAR